MYGYRVVGKNCGRDRDGVFHCFCGKCECLEPNISKDSYDGSHDGSQGGNTGDDKRNQKPAEIGPLF